MVCATRRALPVPDRIFDAAPELHAEADVERTRYRRLHLEGPSNEDSGWQYLAPIDRAIEVHDAGDIDPTAIPPRGWLLGTTFCRKFISGLVAEGAAGKTAIRYAQYLAAATGRPLTCEPVHQRSRVLICCLEDDLDEVKRRIAAAMIHHGVTSAEVKGSLLYSTPRGLKLLQVDPRVGCVVGTLYFELREKIDKLEIDIVGIDPFVKAHGVEENDNNLIDRVCIMLAELADQFNCAIDIVSHARKGAATPGDADRDRGASSKRDAGRLMRTVTAISAAEAEVWGVPSEFQRALVRVDDAKVNITPQSTSAMWFKLVGVPLGNRTTLYPNGDNVHTVERWFPPDIWAEITDVVANEILDKIDRGPEDGRRYSPAQQAKDRAAWPVVVDFCPTLTEEQAKKVIATWLANGVLVQKEHVDPKDRHKKPGLFSGERPGNKWTS